MSDSQILPTRFVLESKHVSACFAAIRKIPPTSAFYADLPASNMPLPEVFMKDGTHLSPELKMAFEILAEPAKVMIVRSANTATATAGLETRFVSSAQKSGSVLISKSTDNVWDLALMTGSSQAVVILSEFLGLNNVPDHSQEFLLDIKLDSLWAFTLILEQIQLSKVQAYLGNEAAEDAWIEPFYETKLKALISPDLTNPQSMRMFMNVLSAGAFSVRHEKLSVKRGLSGLRKLAILDGDNCLTIDGQILAKSFLNNLYAMSILSVQKSRKTIKSDHCFFLCLPDTALCGIWDIDKKGVAKALRLTALSKPAVIGVLDDLISD